MWHPGPQEEAKAASAEPTTANNMIKQNPN